MFETLSWQSGIAPDCRSGGPSGHWRFDSFAQHLGSIDLVCAGPHLRSRKPHRLKSMLPGEHRVTGNTAVSKTVDGGSTPPAPASRRVRITGSAPVPKTGGLRPVRVRLSHPPPENRG